MARTATEKLAATVVEVTYLDEMYPRSVLQGRVGLDVRVVSGTLRVGKRVRLRGSRGEENVEIIGIELLTDPRDPDLVRIHCSKPGMLRIPAGKVTGWMIAED